MVILVGKSIRRYDAIQATSEYPVLINLAQE